MYANTVRKLIVAGDFNVRSEMTDRRNLHGTRDPCLKPLTVEETQLRHALQGDLGLRDTALHIFNELDYLPVHHRQVFL